MKYVEDERSNYQNTRAERFYHQFLKKIDWIQWISAALGLTLLVFLGLLQRDRFFSGQNDFLQLYAGARSCLGLPIYIVRSRRSAFIASVGVELVGVYYSRPPFYADLLWPLGLLPYRAAYWTFESISFAAFVVFLFLFVPQCKELVLFSSLCFPLLSNVSNGQDVTRCCYWRRGAFSRFVMRTTSWLDCSCRFARLRDTCLCSLLWCF